MITHKDQDALFEVSWEVCNKVGGINTVIRSKVPQIMKYYKGNYFLVGPYVPQNALREFQVIVPPEKLQHIFEKLNKEGIICHYGKWLVEDEPKTILVDYHGYSHKNNEIKSKLWESYKIDSLGTMYNDYDEPIIWGEAVGRLLEEITKSYTTQRVIGQFHEWLAAGALLYLKRNKIKIATVFTTHATVLGRTLAGNNIDLYKNLSTFKADEEARKWGMQAKHLTEKAAAREADVFTTVSEITGMEAEQFFNRKPEVLVYNGLDISKYPTFEEASIKHKLYKGKMKSFIEYYFFPYYSFDLDNTLIYFLTGRYEFHNKGIDIFIKALARLNKELKDSNSPKTVIALICVPRDVVRIKQQVIENRALYQDIQESIDDNIDEAERRLIRFLISKNSITEKDLFSKEFLFNLRKKIFRFLKKGTPPLATHDIPGEDQDAIIRTCKESGLINREEDKVKIVFYPVYLTGADNVLDLDYNEAIMGAHLGVFPSYYEPWGYTPLETGALGVAAVTTDLAGFGRYLQTTPLQKKDPGIFIIDAYNKTEEEKTNSLFKVLYTYAQYEKEERIKNKIEARRLAGLADWDKLVENYVQAYELALDKAYHMTKK